MAGERETGIVKLYDPERGFGFITRRGSDDLFVHRTDVERAGLPGLHSGDRVSFAVRRTQRGWQAEQLALEATSCNGRIAPLARPSTSTSFRFGPDYLAEGYFEEKHGQRYLRPDVIDTTAMEVAKLLGNRDLKSSQLRRFFNKARGIAAKLDQSHDFEAVRADIYAFKRDVAYLVGRKMVPSEFQYFIERNVELASQDQISFRDGFLPHLESVVAYFAYFFRDR